LYSNIVLQFVLDLVVFFKHYIQCHFSPFLVVFSFLKTFYKSSELNLECPIIMYCVWYYEIEPIFMVVM
jgi:hypothetical protein